MTTSTLGRAALAIALLGCGGGSTDAADDLPAIDAPPAGIDSDLLPPPDAASGAPDAEANAAPVPDRGVRLAYLATPAASPTAQVDLCMRPTGQEAWTRAYAGTAGVGHGEVGRYQPMSGLGSWDFQIIDASGDCGGAFLYGTTQVIANDGVVKRTTINYALAGGVSVEFRYTRMGAADVVGEDWLTAMDAVDGAVAIRWADGVAPATPITGNAAQLPAGTTGNVEVDIDGAAGTQAFPYVAGSGVATTAFVTGEPDAAQVLYCDELAPTVGPLAQCSATLRSP